MRRLAKAKREIPTDLQSDDREGSDPSPLEGMINEEESTAIQKAMGRIGDICKQLLLLYYWEECSMEEIASRLGFANADTAKTKKYQCKKALEKILKDVTESYG